MISEIGKHAVDSRTCKAVVTTRCGHKTVATTVSSRWTVDQMVDTRWGHGQGHVDTWGGAHCCTRQVDVWLRRWTQVVDLDTWCGNIGSL